MRALSQFDILSYHFLANINCLVRVEIEIDFVIEHVWDEGWAAIGFLIGRGLAVVLVELMMHDVQRFLQFRLFLL